MVIASDGRVHRIAASRAGGRRRLVAVLSLFFTGSVAAELIGDEDVEELQSWVLRVRAIAPQSLTHALDNFDPDLALDLLRQAQAALFDSTIERLARLQPYMHLILKEARRYPYLAPYLPWVEARLDYFDEARRVEAIRRVHVQTLTPSKAPPVPPPSELSRTAWYKRIARPPPPHAKITAQVLKGIFRRNGVPDALVWLAEVESSFNPSARSPAGAVGLYQLMPNTARAWGLNPDASPDERLDPLKNAEAAARYLAHLHRRFRAWPPALAAFNAGETRVARLLRESNGDFDAILPRLPAETRMYVPRVLETVRLREGVDLAARPAW